jgi:hypothetical protein
MTTLKQQAARPRAQHRSPQYPRVVGMGLFALVAACGGSVEGPDATGPGGGTTIVQGGAGGVGGSHSEGAWGGGLSGAAQGGWAGGISTGGADVGGGDSGGGGPGGADSGS